MPQSLNIVASQAMDLYYQDFKSDSDFFSLDDFIDFCGNAVTDYYQQEFLSQYRELKAEKKDEIVSFPDSCLAIDTLEVKDLKAKLKNPFAAFPRDNQNTGIQNVFITEPTMSIAERGNIDTIWQFAYLPSTNRIFFRVEGDTLIFYKKGSANVKEVQIYYVPTANKDMLVPDGIIEYVVMNVPAKMKQVAQGTIVKKSGDGNPNKVLETEIDKQQLR